MADNIQLNMLTLLHELQCFNKNLINKNVKSLADYLKSLKEDFNDDGEEEQEEVISYGLFELFLKYIYRIHSLVNIESTTIDNVTTEKVVDNNVAASTLNALFKNEFALLIEKLKKHIELDSELKKSLAEWIKEVLNETNNEIIMSNNELFNKYRNVTEALNGDFLKTEECWKFITDLTNLLYESVYVNIIDIPIMEIGNIDDLPESIVVELKSHLANSAGSRRKFIYSYVETDGYPIDDSTLSLRTYIETYNAGSGSDTPAGKALDVINQSTKLGQSILAPIYYNIKLIELILKSIKSQEDEKMPLYVYNSLARDALDYHKRCSSASQEEDVKEAEKENRKLRYEELISGIAKGNVEKPTEWLYMFLSASLSSENQKYNGIKTETILKNGTDNFIHYKEGEEFDVGTFKTTTLNPKFVDLIHELILIIEIIYLSHAQPKQEESKRSSKLVNYSGENVVYDTYKNVFIKKNIMSTRDGEESENTALSTQLINCLVTLYNIVYGEELEELKGETLLYVRRFYNCLLNIGEDDSKFEQNIREGPADTTTTNDTTTDELEKEFKFNIMRDFECITPYIHSVVESVSAADPKLKTKLNAYFKIISMYIRQSLKGKVDSIEDLIEIMDSEKEFTFTIDEKFKKAFIGFNNMLIKKEGDKEEYFRADMFSINHEILKSLKDLNKDKVQTDDKLILLCFVLVINNLMNIHNIEGKKFFEVLLKDKEESTFKDDVEASAKIFGKAPKITTFTSLDNFIKSKIIPGTYKGDKFTLADSLAFTKSVLKGDENDDNKFTKERIYYRYYPRKLNEIEDKKDVFEGNDNTPLLEVKIVVYENEVEKKRIYCITDLKLIGSFSNATYKDASP